MAEHPVHVDQGVTVDGCSSCASAALRDAWPAGALVASTDSDLTATIVGPVLTARRFTGPMVYVRFSDGFTCWTSPDTLRRI